MYSRRCFQQVVDKVLVSETVNDFSTKNNARMNARDDKSNSCREDVCGLVDLFCSNPICCLLKNSEGGLIFALFHCHFVVRKQPVFLTTHRESDRKFNELSKNM